LAAFFLRDISLPRAARWDRVREAQMSPVRKHTAMPRSKRKQDDRSQGEQHLPRRMIAVA
jgi:hypothetical protein